ncbi:B2 protein-like [Anticarsia gemmatalis]|uniref:B2 protein-like n=1 Tax=Anticarsia gemmatalis TaxID=129554 RepID=UPI003F770F89
MTPSTKTGDPMVWALAVVMAVVALTEQATMGCKNCIMLGKEEKAMFRAHSDACLPMSHVDQRLVDAMLAGELLDEAPLRKHVYCVLLKCKLVSKDGKLLKNAVLGKMAARPDAKNATKVLESCAEQTGDTPEDLAWNLFRCGYDKKALLFEYMPTGTAGSGDTDNTN